MSGPPALNFLPRNADQYSYHPSNPGSYPPRTTQDDPARSQRLQYPSASNVPATTPPQLRAAPPPNLHPRTPPQLQGVPSNSPPQLQTSPPDYGARAVQYLHSPPYGADPRRSSQDGRNPYFPDSAVPSDYRGLNAQATPFHNGHQNGPNSYQPPSPVSPPRQLTWPNSPPRSPNIAPQQHPNPQMAAHPHPQERGFSVPNLYLQPPSTSPPPNHPSMAPRRSFEDLGGQSQTRSFDLLSISAPNPSVFDQLLPRSPPVQTQVPMNMYTMYAQNNQPNVVQSGHPNISTIGQRPNGYSNTQPNGLPNTSQNGSNVLPNGRSNIVYQSQSNLVQNGPSNISRTPLPNVAPNGQGHNGQPNIPQNSQSKIAYNGQQNATPNRSSNSNGSTGGSRVRNNSESELPAGVFWTTWDWIADNFYGISESITPLGRGSYGKVFEV